MKSLSILPRTRPMFLAVTFSAALILLFNSCKPVAEDSNLASAPEPAAASEAPEPAVATEAPEPAVATEAPEPAVATEAPEPAVTSEAPEPAVATEVPSTAPETKPENAPEEVTEPTNDSVVETKPESEPIEEKQPAEVGKLAVATFGNGCFWCTEAVMDRLEGVSGAVSGYMGGHVENPSYEQVCGKKTGHAEVVQVTYDPGKISYEELLDIFWHSHDPTTLNRQGNDVGPQYRSAIFFHDNAQKLAAENSMAKENSSGDYGAPIVTEITEASTFWKAEIDHQDFFERNPNNPYCRALIPPKLRKLGLE